MSRYRLERQLGATVPGVVLLPSWDRIQSIPACSDGSAPKEHFLSEVHELRSISKDKNLDDVFLHREQRLVRKDGTVRWHGGFLEVRPELVGETVELRFDPVDTQARPRVFVDDHFFCDTVPLDRVANATRRRRRITNAPLPAAEPSGLDPLRDLVNRHYRYDQYDRVRSDDARPQPRAETDPSR